MKQLIYAHILYFVILGSMSLSAWIFAIDANDLIGFSALMVACIALMKEST